MESLLSATTTVVPARRGKVNNMEPSLITAPALEPVLLELQRREPLFHHPELGTTRRDFEAMTAEDFWEVGASGRRYSREYVLSVLADRRAGSGPIDVWSATDFHCRQLHWHCREHLLQHDHALQLHSDERHLHR